MSFVKHTLLYIIAAIVLISCSNDKKSTVAPFADRSQVPILHTFNVLTMVSDSGITRYRISAPEWLVYDKVAEPYWDFPQGIYFERFDGEYRTDADIVSDKAVFYDKKKLWHLTGNVKAKNLTGEIFESPQLFWDQNEERIYSPDSVTITQSDKVIYGIGFDSNQTLTKYEILKVSGIFPIDDDE